jgi:hypothetical protein
MRFEYEPIAFPADLDVSCDAAVDSKGLIYSLAGKYPLTVYNQKGEAVDHWTKDVLCDGHGLYIDENDFIYVIDSGWLVLSKYDTKGNLLLQYGNKGVPSDTGCVKGNFKTIQRGAGPFNAPSKVTVSPKGEVFVTDGYGNARVHRFSKDFKLLASWGEPGGGPGQFRIPHGIGVDEFDRVYVADRENNRIQIFDVEGKLLNIWENVNRPDGIYVRDGIVYVGELGHIFYVDNVLFEPYENMPWSRMRLMDYDGNDILSFGGPEGWKTGNMWAVHGVNLDREGNIYVPEAGWPTGELGPAPEGPHPALQNFKRID